MSYGLIYLILNKTNKKAYIGQTTMPIELRWKCHKQVAKHNLRTHALSNAIKKYGEANFSIQVLGTYPDRESLNKAEIDAIRYYDTLAPKGYNVKEGGSSGKHSAETRQKISKAHKGKPTPEWVRQARSERMKGVSHSEEVRAKISAALKGRLIPLEVRQRMNKAKIGLSRSEETKQRIANKHKGKIVSEITKEKLRQHNLGKRASEETKRKMREAHARRKLTA